MKRMTEDSIIPYLRKTSAKGKRVIKHKTLHTIGISESLLYETVGDIKAITGNHNNANVRLAFLPSNYETRMRITVEAKNESDAAKAIQEAEKKLLNKAGKYIYSKDGSSIAETIGKLLKKKKKTIAIAESCTGGLIASKITDVAGSSDYFLESVTAYANKSKIKILGVKAATIKKSGAVSRQTAIEMASGIKTNFRSRYRNIDNRYCWTGRRFKIKTGRISVDWIFGREKIICKGIYICKRAIKE